MLATEGEVGKIYVVDAATSRRYRVAVALQPGNRCMTRVTARDLQGELERLCGLTEFSLQLDGLPVAPEMVLPASVVLVVTPTGGACSVAETARHIVNRESDLAYHQATPAAAAEVRAKEALCCGDTLPSTPPTKTHVERINDHVAPVTGGTLQPGEEADCRPLTSAEVRTLTEVKAAYARLQSEVLAAAARRQREREQKQQQDQQRASQQLAQLQQHLGECQASLQGVREELSAAREAHAQVEQRLSDTGRQADAASTNAAAATRRLDTAKERIMHLLASLPRHTHQMRGTTEDDIDDETLVQRLISSSAHRQRSLLRLQELVHERACAQSQLQRLEQQQRRLRYDVEEHKGAVRVVVRMRPRVAEEASLGRELIEEGDVALDEKHGTITVTSPSTGKRAFEFFSAYGPASDSGDACAESERQQQCIFDEQVQPLLELCVAGTNATILAYGPTGSGKTFTIVGRDGVLSDTGDCDSDGLLPRSVRWLTNKLQQGECWRILSLHLSVVELYNDRIFDLLATPTEVTKKCLDCRTHATTSEPPSTRVAITDWACAVRAFNHGMNLRETHTTFRNAASSRSHLFATFWIQSEAAIDGCPINSKLMFCDLAGSERVSQSLASGERLREAQYINKSLSAIGDVLCALTSANAGAAPPHVPYRNNKVTQMLQGSMGGDAKTLLVACISPHTPRITKISETLSTLQFASRAKRVYNKMQPPQGTNAILMDNFA
ncbi:kinesin-14 [Trypanosoma grayi]|uniref:kinesin-14 n=1 Tax=Trypanosoma grayi TaxID=71804 RepID=UPI0004F41D6A|nr:kinesin-14 [Trypanosoma grayi]KEG15403.1 kinesin-14 [Trypanosoma grayi]